MIELKKIENLYIQRAIVRTNITKTLNKGSAYMFINNGEENTVNDIRNFLSKKTKFVPFGNIKTVVTPNTDIATFNSSTIMRIKNNRAETIKKFKTELPEISNVKLDASQTQNLNAISYIPWYFELSQKYNREDKSIKLFSAILENFRRQFYIPTKFGDKTKADILENKDINYTEKYMIFYLNNFDVPKISDLNLTKSGKSKDILRNFLYFLSHEAKKVINLIEGINFVFISNNALIRFNYSDETKIAECWFDTYDEEGNEEYYEISEVNSVKIDLAEASKGKDANPFIEITRTLTILINKIVGDNRLSDSEEKIASTRIDKQTSNEIEDKKLIDGLVAVEDKLETLPDDLSNELTDDIKRLDSQYDNGTKQNEELEMILKKVEENRQRQVKIISPAERAALNRMNKVQIGKTKHTLEDVVTKTVDTPIEPMVVPVNSHNGYETNNFHNFTDTYNKEMREQDIVRSLAHFKDAEVPLYVEKVEIEDTSDRFNEQETVRVKFRDEDNNTFTVTMDLPKVYKGNRIKLNSSEKVIVGQLTFLPILKINDSVIITTNYNKLFMEKRYGNGLSPQANKMLRAFKKMFENNINPDKIFYGDYSGTNQECLFLSEEIKELSTQVMFIGSRTIEEIRDNIKDLKPEDYFILFGCDDIQLLFPETLNNEYIQVGMINGDAIMQHRTTGRITIESANLIDVSLYDAILALSDEKNLGIRPYYDDIKTLNKLTSTHVKVMDNWTPLIYILVFTNGLQVILEKLGVKFEIIPIEQKQRRVDKEKELKIVLADCIVYLNVEESAHSILLYPLSDTDLSMYELADLELPERTADILVDYAGGNINFPTYLATFRDCLIDPITKDILASLEQPTDFLGVFLYANNLLSSPISMEELSLNSCRIRYAEIVQGVMYKNLADAYGEYSVKKKRGSKSATMSVARNKVCVDVMALPNVEEYSRINPYQESVKRSSCNYKGHVGKNLSRAYTWKSRSYHKSYVGSIGLPTAFSANIGITKQLTIDPKVRNLRGMFDVPTDEEIDNGTIDTKAIITSTEAITVGSASHSDPPRIAMNQSQKSHIVPINNMESAYYSNSYDQALPYYTEDFCDKAKNKGTVESVSEFYIVVRYDDKTVDTIKLERINKNSAKGKHVIQYMNTNVKAGQKVKPGDILAYDKDFIKMSPTEGPIMTMGTNAIVSIKSDSTSFEDSVKISESLSRKMMNRSIKRVASRIPASSTMKEFKTIGDMVLAEDTVFGYVINSEDDALNEYLEKSVLSELDLEERTSHKAGMIKQVNIFYSCDKSSLSPSLAKFVDKIKSDIMNKKDEKSLHKTTDDFTVREYSELPEEVKAGFKTNGDLLDKNEVLIEYYIEYLDFMSPGDKLSTFTALKGITTIVTPDSEMPMCYETGRVLDAIISIYSVGARKVFDVLIAAGAGTLMYHITYIARVSFGAIKDDKVKKMSFDAFKKWVLQIINKADPSGLNEKKMKDIFKTLTEAQLKSYVKDPNFKFRLYVDEFHNELDYGNILAACDMAGAIYQERLIFDRERKLVTDKKYPVVLLPMTRLQQKTETESASSSDTDRRNSMGQVVNESKSAQFSKPELAATISTNRFEETKEMMMVRAGGEEMKQQVYNQILNEGTATMSDKEIDLNSRKEVNKLKVNYLIMNLKLVE